MNNGTGKQPMSIYTVMLILSMIFMLGAVLAMFLELSRWYPDLWNTGVARPQSAITQTVRSLLA